MRCLKCEAAIGWQRVSTVMQPRRARMVSAMYWLKEMPKRAACRNASLAVQGGRGAEVIKQLAVGGGQVLGADVLQVRGDSLLHLEVDHVVLAAAERVQRDAEGQQFLIAAARFVDRGL